PFRDASIPHADRRLLAHGATALQQHCSCGHSGAGSSAGWNAVAAHELAGRDARIAHRACRPHRPSNSTDHRSRDRSHEYCGSIRRLYFLERLTLDMEKGCWEYFDRLDALGGMVAAIEKGFPQREIHDASYKYQKAVERKEKIIVGVNEFAMEDEPP